MVDREIVSYKSPRPGDFEGRPQSAICSAIWNGRVPFIWFEECRFSCQQVHGIWADREGDAISYQEG